MDNTTAPGTKRQRREAKPIAPLTSWGIRILDALQGRPMFQGIDPELDPAAANRLARRRRRNRLAKASRKINRRR